MSDYPVQVQRLDSELYGPFNDPGEVVRSATPAGLAALLIWGLTAAWVPGTTLSTSGVAPTITAWLGQIGRSTGHWQNEWNTNPSQIRTDVYYQLKS